MYENKTYDELLTEAKGSIPDDILKAEGSLVHNALAALAFEAEKVYIQMDYIINQSYTDTADIEHLERITATRNIYRKKASNAYMRGVFNIAVPIGTRFNLAGYNFSVSEELTEQFNYSLKCEEPGSGPNDLRGTMTAIDYVSDLSEMEITDILVAGEDDETREALHNRYLQSFAVESFGGNVAAYKNYVTAIAGIGGCKVFPVWDGPGTTKVVAISSNWEPVSNYLIEQIQADMCPVPEKGYGFSPIGSDAVIESATEVEIAVQTSITFSNGYSWAVCQNDIISAVESYFEELRKAWADGREEDAVIVHISKLESVILDVQGVLDIYGTTFNGEASNMTLTSVQIPGLESVVVV